MKLSTLVGNRFKETPADCVVTSHALMLRGGYMKYVANGIYTALPPLKRITRKIEEIAFEELKAALPSTPVQDVPLELARTFGIRRLAAGARTRLEAVIRLSVQHHNGDRN